MTVSTGSRGGNAATLRQRNSSAVLDILRRSATPLRVAEVAQLADLSRPTVETVAQGLLEQGWLQLVGPQEASGQSPAVGRPARLFALNERARHVVGVDIGAHRVTVALGDLRGAVVTSRRRSLPPEMPSSRRLATTAALVGEVLADAAVDTATVVAMTVGTPGTVPGTNDRVGLSPGIPGWASVDVRQALQDTVGCAIEVENDANLAAVGERARGVAAGCADLVFLLLGERLGAGVIANDALVRGRNGAAGELGYVPVGGTEDRDARYGPLESQVNASALVRLGEAAAREHPESALARCSPLTADGITRAATGGDAVAGTVLQRLAGMIAAGVAPTLLTLNPEKLVIGGGVSLAGEVLRGALDEAIARLVLYPPEVHLSALGDDAVVVGAVARSLERVEVEVLAHVSA